MALFGFQKKELVIFLIKTGIVAVGLTYIFFTHPHTQTPLPGEEIRYGFPLTTCVISTTSASCSLWGQLGDIVLALLSALFVMLFFRELAGRPPGKPTSFSSEP
jgi:hypothetical protein